MLIWYNIKLQIFENMYNILTLWPSSGLSYTKKKYFLSRAKKAKTSKKSSDKAFIQVACEESCDAGTMVCRFEHLVHFWLIQIMNTS